jgi:hypothetical protein
MLKRLIAYLVFIPFLTSLIPPSSHAEQLVLPPPGAMVNLSSPYIPVLLEGLKIHPENPFLFDFIIDPGNSGFRSEDASLQKESEKLIKYFLAAMTVPEKDLWVNLSPYEKNRMIEDNLGQTEMGRDMLAQDYILKQLTASLIYPEKTLGKSFWDKIYSKAQALYGTTEIPVNTFNKVWIVADKADVFERNNTAYVAGAHLKVMLEEDYLALSKKEAKQTDKAHSLASQVVREVVLPALETEVNTGKNFAPLRQMFYSMILASWYKMALKDALLTQIYGNQSKVKIGINQEDPRTNEEIFQRYVQAYRKGVFNYIKDDINQATQESVPRKYFSGGFDMAMLTKQVHRLSELPPKSDLPTRVVFVVRTKVNTATQSGNGKIKKELPSTSNQRTLLFFPEKNQSFYQTVQALAGLDLLSFDSLQEASSQLAEYQAVLMDGNWIHAHKEEGLKFIATAVAQLKAVTIVGQNVDQQLIAELKELETKARQKRDSGLAIIPIHYANYSEVGSDRAMVAGLPERLAAQLMDSDIQKTILLRTRFLGQGAILRTSLNETDLEKVRSTPQSFYVSSSFGFRGELALKTREWPYIDTQLSEVDSRLDLIAKVGDVYRQKKEPVVIVDWGCGTGRALKELKTLLDQQGIRSQLIGISQDYYPEWEQMPAGITLILDDAVNLPKYLKENSADIIFSYSGLSHFLSSKSSRTDLNQNRQQHVNGLQKILKDKGILRFTFPFIWKQDDNPELIRFQRQRKGSYSYLELTKDSAMKAFFSEEASSIVREAPRELHEIATLLAARRFGPHDDLLARVSRIEEALSAAGIDSKDPLWQGAKGLKNALLAQNMAPKNRLVTVQEDDAMSGSLIKHRILQPNNEPEYVYAGEKTIILHFNGSQEVVLNIPRQGEIQIASSSSSDFDFQDNYLRYNHQDLVLFSPNYGHSTHSSPNRYDVYNKSSQDIDLTITETKDNAMLSKAPSVEERQYLALRISSYTLHDLGDIAVAIQSADSWNKFFHAVNELNLYYRSQGNRGYEQFIQYLTAEKKPASKAALDSFRALLERIKENAGTSSNVTIAVSKVEKNFPSRLPELFQSVSDMINLTNAQVFQSLPTDSSMESTLSLGKLRELRAGGFAREAEVRSMESLLKRIEAKDKEQGNYTPLLEAVNSMAKTIRFQPEPWMKIELDSIRGFQDSFQGPRGVYVLSQEQRRIIQSLIQGETLLRTIGEAFKEKGESDYSFVSPDLQATLRGKGAIDLLEALESIGQDQLNSRNLSSLKEEDVLDRLERTKRRLIPNVSKQYGLQIKFQEDGNFWTLQTADKAMSTFEGVIDNSMATRGGIDLDRSKLQMNIQKEGTGVQMQFDPTLIEQIKQEGFDGLEFTIQSIVPVSNLPLLLGLETSPEQQLAKAM